MILLFLGGTVSSSVFSPYGTFIKMKNYAELIPVLKEIVMLAKKKDITIREVLQKLDHYGFSLIALLLVLPFMQPFPVGPLSVLGGMTFAALGWQILQKKPTPLLPKKILTLKMELISE